MDNAAEIEAAMRGPDAYRVARKALDAMISLKVWPTPAHYELWLQAAAAPTSPLAREIDRIAAAGEAFTDSVCEALASQFLPRVQANDRLREAGDQLTHELETIGRAIQAAAASNQVYGGVLAEAGAELETADPATLRTLVADLAEATRHAEHQNKMLERQLAESTSEVTKLRDSLEEVRKDATTDALTGLGNRRAFDFVLTEAINIAQTKGQSLALAVLDIDHFKRFNDTWGHQTGDQVLRYVSGVISKNAREPRFAARLGGEEFAIVCPGEAAFEMHGVLQEILNEIASRALRRRSTNEDLGAITISAGLAELAPGENLQDFFERADAALYASKRSGRNRVTNTGKVVVEAAA